MNKDFKGEKKRFEHALCTHAAVIKGTAKDNISTSLDSCITAEKKEKRPPQQI